MSHLNKPVLVLNKVWMPVRVVKAIRAFKLLFANKASAVNTDTFYIYNWGEWLKQPFSDSDFTVSTVNFEIKVPEVIVLCKYDKVFKKHVKLTKRNIYIRDNYTCQYSGKKVNKGESDIDHVVPLSKGGKNSWENMVVCSKNINRKKANKSLKQSGLKLIKNPTIPDNTKLLIDPKMKIPESWRKFIQHGK